MKLAAVLVLAVACGHSSGDAPPPPAPTPAPAAKAHHHEDRHDPQAAPTAFSLDVTVDGVHQTWTPATFAKVPHVTGTNNDGEAREVWSLRALAANLVGSAAHVVSVTGNVTEFIGDDAWTDPARVPILHSTRRGLLKFRWTDPDGTWRENNVVKNVAKLAISTK